MFFGDHAPPHFHAQYGEHQAVLDIYTLVVIDGYLLPRALGLVVEWASQHREELLDLVAGCKPSTTIPDPTA